MGLKVPETPSPAGPPNPKSRISPIKIGKHSVKELRGWWKEKALILRPSNLSLEAVTQEKKKTI